MNTFSMLDHLDKLKPVEGKPAGEYHCPLCGAENFKVNLKTGAYSGYGCGCTDTDEGRRQVRDAVSPLERQDAPRNNRRAKPKKSERQMNRDAELTKAQIEIEIDHLVVQVAEDIKTRAEAELDLSTWCKEHGHNSYTAGQLLKEKLDTVAPKKKTSSKDGPTLFELAMDIALKDVEYFTLPGGSGAVAADVIVEGHRETFQISKRPQRFKDWLQFAMWMKHGKVLGSETMQQVVSTVSCMARAGGIQHQLHVRVASHADAIYLDLGKPDWSVARVTADGWTIIPSADCPVRFIRTNGVGELPTPEPGGTLNDIRRIANVDDQGLVLLMTWMLFCLCPDYDHPILIVSGSAGSGKTKLCESIKTLIDPAPTLLMSLPKEERNLKAQATNRWLLGYDNLSGMGNDISDSLCRLATGGGLVDRKLHTDDDESEFSGVRPILLNGIDALGNRSDFRSRAIEINCPRLEYKMPSSEYTATLEAVRPLVLGMLLNAASQALKLVPDAQHVTDTRMGDFECWGTAAETTLGFPPGTFLEAFQANIIDLRNAGIEAHPVASALMEFMESRDEWEGTTAELLKHLECLVPEETRRSRAFPKDPTRLSKALKRIQPDLEPEIEMFTKRNKKARTISLRKVVDFSVTSVTLSQNPYESRDRGVTLKKLQRHPSVTSVIPSVTSVTPGVNINVDGDAKKQGSDLASPLASPGEIPSWQGFQGKGDAGDAGDAKIRAYSRCPPSAPEVSNTSSHKESEDEWVYWWRVDAPVKVLWKRYDRWRIRVPGEINPRIVPAEEFVNDHWEGDGNA